MNPIQGDSSTVVIVGGGSGIGAAAARLLVAQGPIVNLASIVGTTIVCDGGVRTGADWALCDGWVFKSSDVARKPS